MATLIETTLDLAKRLGRMVTGARPESDEALKAFADVAWKFVKNAYVETAEQRTETQKLRDFYNGDQITGTGLNEAETYVPVWPDETDEDLETRTERMQAIAWNRIRDGVFTHADALYALAVSREIRWADGAAISDGDKKWLDSYFRDRVQARNRYGQFMWDLWCMVGSERQAVVMGMWLDGTKRRLKRFPAGATREEMKDKGLVWLEALDNLQVIALPDSTQPRELGAVIRWYADPQSTEAETTVAQPGAKNTITELITDTLWLRWRGTKLEPHMWGFENRYGDVRALFAWVRNPGQIADSEDALAAQVLLLEHLYGAWEIKRNHAFPETLYSGYEPPTREENGRKILLRGPNVAHVSPDPQAKITKVGPPAGLEDIGVADTQMHAMIDEAMGVSAIERGEGLGQLRSAPAVGRVMGKSERRRHRKMVAAEAGENDLFSMIRDMTVFHTFDEEDRDAFLGSELIVTYPEDAFTLDAYSMAQKDLVEVTGGFSEIKDQVKKRHPNLSDEEIDAKVATIQKEMKARETRGTDQNPTSKSRSQSA